MVLSVPPLLEELMGRHVTEDATHALATWQGVLWGAAQRLRERPEQSDGVQRRWMGTTDQLSSVIAGSVVLGGDDTALDVVPLSTEATPAVKGSPHGVYGYCPGTRHGARGGDVGGAYRPGA
ncbi:hypothetical protein AB1Y20_001256 [Prymnesium parvum]|uniref:Uncharacterized protein n=1 Tax=Prymnesium parvum TaxID=97485 RepID=A0AB34KAC8_PRYPA